MPHIWTTELWLPQPAETLFGFLTDVSHLDALTPPWLEFRVLSSSPGAIGPGALLDYALSIRGVPVRWRTEITAWEPPHRFAERQARGPFRRWEQEHRLAPDDGGTRLQETMSYEVTGGAWIDRLLVRPHLHRVFAFRAARLAERFGASAGGARHHP